MRSVQMKRIMNQPFLPESNMILETLLLKKNIIKIITLMLSHKFER